MDRVTDTSPTVHNLLTYSVSTKLLYLPLLILCLYILIGSLDC